MSKVDTLSWIREDKVLHDLQVYFGLTGELKQLGSCQDINYRLTTASNQKYVVKYLNNSITWSDIFFQHQILDFLKSFPSEVRQLLIPYPIKRCDDSSTVVAFKDSEGNEYHMCVLVFVEGDILSSFKYLHPTTLFDIGKDVASFDKLLAAFPLSDDYSRHSEWDMRKAADICSQRKSSIKDLDLQQQMMKIVDNAAQILHTHEGSLTHQLIHGDLADYNVIAEPTNVFGRPKIIGVIDFGDIVESWLIAEIANCLVPLFYRQNHDPLEMTIHVVRGFCSIKPLSEIELRCLWHLILLRSVLLCMNVSFILQSDPTNTYLLEEEQLNYQIYQKLLAYPIQFAIHAILEAGNNHNHLNYRESNESDLLSNHNYFLKEPIFDHAIIDIDLSCENPLYHSGNWEERGTENTLIRQQIHAHDNIEHSASPTSARTLTSSRRPSLGAMKMFEIKFGCPWFTNANKRSLEAPRSISTFSLYMIPKSTKICAPWDGTARYSEDPHHIEQLFQDLKAVKRSESVARAFGSFSSTPKVLEIMNDQYTILMVGIHAAAPLVNFDSTWHVKMGDKLGEVNSDCIEGHFSPVFIQVFVTPDPEIKSYNSIIPEYPPLFVTAEEWKVYRCFCFDANILFTGRPRHTNTSQINLPLQKRHEYASHCQEHYYQTPPQIERGYQQYLYDISGRGYLDLVNNVAIVGHSHPKIATRAHEQLLKLNTNSRFVYASFGNFAEKILEHIPIHLREAGKLNRVFFVNSGSEATDLALRIARTVVSERRMKEKNHRKEDQLFHLCRDVLSIQGGYHGITTASDEVSTTLNDNPRSLETRASWIHLVPMPNFYRGIHSLPAQQGQEEAKMIELANQYVELVKNKIENLKQSGIIPAAFIAEPLNGNAGGVIMPPTYLRQVYELVHELGGLCIDDEVQVGYGRLGNVFWGFEEHEIVPDIVTMAKAAGNGHPLGFVITSEQIAQEFYESQGSFFSSAGGGPVSCVIGSTVLEIIDREALQRNALEVGNYFQQKLWEIREKFSSLVGCIHGHGLYQGIEIIKPDGSKGEHGEHLPGTDEAYAICDRLLQLGVISHNTGDHSNVLKVKPPLCLTKEDVDFFCDAFEIALSGF